MQPSYTAVVDHLLEASIPVRQLRADHGAVAVIPHAGRVIAMAFSPDDFNLLWTHPQLAHTELVQRPEHLSGGLGGDRLWFSPESTYHWDGAPNWKTFENYAVPSATDPGAYRFVEDGPQRISLSAAGELTPRSQSTQRIGFTISRTIRLVEPPLDPSDSAMSGVTYVGIESSHHLRLTDSTRSGVIALWHLLQAPRGAVLVVPLERTAEQRAREPLSYALKGDWTSRADQVRWRYGGEANAKLGLSAAAVRGRSAVFHQLEPRRWCMVAREFPVHPQARYADHPYGVECADQVFQAWDGYGFGEMEFHSPAIDAEHGPRELSESDRLWAFGGAPEAISRLAAQVLGVDVDDIFAAPR